MLGVEFTTGFFKHLPNRRTARDPRPGDVDPFENVLGGLVAGDRHQPVLLRSAALERAHTLALVHAAAHARYFAVGMAEHWIVLARIDLSAILELRVLAFLLRREGEHVPHQPLRLPWLYPLQLLRKTIRIGGGGERLSAENRRRLVLPMPVARSAGEAQNDDIRLKLPDHPDHVAQDFIVPPFL